MPAHEIPRGLQKLRRAGPALSQDRLPASLVQRMAELATPGASIALIDDFKVAWARGFGVRSSGGADEVTQTTLFQAGSISKLVFAVAVARLAQEKALDLDADVNGYLTSWRIPCGQSWSPRITLRQLLSHTAGTTVHGFPGYSPAGPWPTIPQILDGTPPANTEPVVVNMLPGLQFVYSGGGTTIAQLAICDLLGRPFPELMQALVLGPLRMTSSTFAYPLPARLAARAAIGHPWNGTPMPGGWHVFPEMAAAGLWTTAEDLARLGIDFMRALRGEASAIGLTAGTAAQMLQPPFALRQDSQSFVGLGFFCRESGAAFRCGHPGSNHGFVAEITLLPEVGKGAVVMLNSNQGAPLRQEIFEALGKEYEWPGSTEYDGVTVRTEDIIGSYRHASGKCLEIIEAENGFELCFEMQANVPISAASENTFVARGLNLTLCFRKNADGQTVAASLTQGSQAAIEFEKNSPGRSRRSA